MVEGAGGPEEETALNTITMHTAYIYDDVPRCASQFTGKERDSETGLDYFGARYYGSNMGRWMSPDWAATATAVPYADSGNPQSLNLYSYVGNNPLARADVDGHCWPACDIVMRIVEYVSVHTASTGTRLANTRAGYNAANKLTFTQSGRDLNKVAARSTDVPLGRGLAEVAAENPQRGASRAAKSVAQLEESISRTSPAANELAATARKIGKGAAVVAVVAGGVEVATAPDGERARTATGVVGGLAGAWAGGEWGAGVGAAVGSVFPGPGTAIGAGVGGLVGGIGGGLLGRHAATDMYDTVERDAAKPQEKEN